MCARQRRRHGYWTRHGVGFRPSLLLPWPYAVGRRAPLDETVTALKALGVAATAIVGDVSDPKDCPKIIAETAAALGGLHILVNNAGIARTGALAETSDEDMAAMLDTNVKGAMLLTKYALPELEKAATAAGRGAASVLMIASSVADKPLKDFSVYSAAKAALVHFSRCLALELSAKGIRVNCVNPGAVETPIFATMMPSAVIPRALKMYAGMTPLGRVGQPNDIAQAALYLSGPGGDWVTGAVLTVDGGISLT